MINEGFKMKIQLICLALITLLSVSKVQAETTYVYCAAPDGSDWDWLLDSADNYVLIEGTWGRHTYMNQSYFNYFNISTAQYQLVNSQCPLGDVAQPGGRYTRSWDVFNLLYPNGATLIAEGQKSIFHANLELYLPSAFRL
jgi:hypothetical protein